MIILRIFSPSCRYRISISETATLYELYEAISKESGRIDDISSLYVFLDSNCNSIVSKSHRTTVAQTAIDDGDILYIHWSTQPSNKSKSSPKCTTAEVKESSKNQTSIDSAQTPPVNDTSHQTVSTKPKFQSFDAYLKQKLYCIADLPLCINYRPVNIVKNHLTKLPPAITLKHQLYRHIDHVEFKNTTELNNFVNFWQFDLDMARQRGGWLLGHYCEDLHYESGIRVVVEAIYEPPQTNTDGGSVIFLEDSFLPTVKKLSETLGISIVGWIFTHLSRDEKLTSQEIIDVIKFQWDSIKTAPSHYTGYPVSPFVTVTISQSEEQQIQTNAFMVSDLAMAFYRDGLLAETQLNPAVMQLTFPMKHESYPEILQSGKAVTSFDPDWFIVRVNESAPLKSDCMFKACNFPVENRFDSIQLEQIVNSIKDVTDKPETFSDFHFLLYLAKLFDVATADSICHAIRHEHPVDSEIIDTLLTFAQ